MTKKEILEEFMTQWDKLKSDKIITIEEFEDYYKDVSASIDRDDYFELMMRNAWKITEAKPKVEVMHSLYVDYRIKR